MSGEDKRGKPGKRRQIFTQRALERAQRAAPNRTIIIRADGSLELPPPAAGASEPQENTWKDLLKDAPDEKRSA